MPQLVTPMFSQSTAPGSAAIDHDIHPGHSQKLILPSLGDNMALAGGNSLLNLMYPLLILLLKLLEYGASLRHQDAPDTRLGE